MKRNNNISYSNDNKRKIRELLIYPSVRSSGTLLDFYGSGENHRFIQSKASELGKINLLSIDCDPKKERELKRTPDARLIELKELCQEYCDDQPTDDKKFGTIWIDYCGKYEEKKLEDFSMLKYVMKERGELFVTFFKGREDFGLKAGAGRARIERDMMDVIYLEFANNNIAVDCTQCIDYNSIIENATTGKLSKKPSHMMVYKFSWKKWAGLGRPMTYHFQTLTHINLDKGGKIL